MPFVVWLALIALLGGIAGLGTYTFIFAQGASYLSDDPRACANCHIMRDVYDSYNRASHKAIAVCNDCHTPHTSIVAKYAVKGIDGVKHSFAFTTGLIHEPIQITGMNRDIAQENCLRCHGDMVSYIYHARSNQPTYCLRCHATVGHDE
jgi:cytochrome c nitrite reductase small subunit